MMTYVWVCLLTATSIEPLSPEHAELFAGTREDKLDKEVCEEEQPRVTRKCRDELIYVVSNELAQHVFAPYIRNVGGGYVGIGTEQNFTFIAWSKPTLAWMLDYDPVIVFLNRVHQAFIANAESPDAFRALWKPSNRKEALGVLRENLVGVPKVKPHIEVYKKYRRRLYNYFQRRLKMESHEGAPHWLATQESFQYVHDLVVAGRLRVMKGDLLKKRGLTGIGEAASSLGVTVRVVYLSNAEEFWKYSKQFRRNFRGLPMDEQSLIIRTRHSDKFGMRLDERFAYGVQRGLSFQEALADKANNDVDLFLDECEIERDGVMRVDVDLPKEKPGKPAKEPKKQEAPPKKQAAVVPNEQTALSQPSP